MRLREKKLKQLIEAARRTKTMGFEWTAEACYWLQRGESVDEEARAEVARIVEEVEESLGVGLNNGASRDSTMREKCGPCTRSC